MKLNPITSRLLQSPLLMTGKGFSQFLFSLNEIPIIDEEEEEIDDAKVRAKFDRTQKFWKLRDDGIAVLEIDRPLMHKASYYEHVGYYRSYESIVANYEEAHAHKDVKGIVLEMNSPGGEGAGIKDAVEHVYSLKEKPTWTFVNKEALSAGQWWASVSDRTVNSTDGEMGSVGVWSAHQNMEKMLENIGIDITLITSGEHKVDGHPFGPLPDSVKADWQRSSDALRSDFAGAVGEYRGIPQLRVLETEAKTYRGQEAVDVGFSDEVLREQEFYGSFSDYLKGSSSGAARKQPEVQVTDKAEGSEINQAAIDEAYNKGLTKGREEGAKAASETFVKVLGHEAAAGKHEAAIKYLGKGYSADDTIEILADISSPAQEEKEEQTEELEEGLVKALLSAIKKESPGVINHSVEEDTELEEDKILKADEKAVKGLIASIQKGGLLNGQ